jgi:hypothetical protein
MAHLRRFFKAARILTPALTRDKEAMAAATRSGKGAIIFSV